MTFSTTSAYTAKQIDHYLDYISFPQELRSAPRDAHFLKVLHTHQISKIPYDNLSLHYNPSHCNDLDPQVLFEKFTTNGRGGYCMEQTLFYRNILLELGFDVYSAGARIRLRQGNVPVGDFIGWVHCVNIVTLPTGEKFSCDVGFGGDGPTLPLPLLHAVTHQNLGTQQIRLYHDHFPTHQGTTQPKFWFYQYRNTPDAEWNTYYGFPEMSLGDHDLEMMNYWTSRAPESFQRNMMILVKFLREEVGEGKDGGRIVGKVMLANGLVKRNLGGKTELVKECRTEEERVEALRERFGIELTQEQRDGIRGYVTELKETGSGEESEPGQR